MKSMFGASKMDKAYKSGGFPSSSLMDTIVPGRTAQDKMKELAQTLYQQTPQLEKDHPQAHIQIFAAPSIQVDKRSQLLAGTSSQYSASQQDMLKELRKKEASLRSKIAQQENDDDSSTVMRQYLTWEEAKQHSKELKQQLISKQEYYIRREQEYRKTIDDIHNEIAKRSSDPFGFLSQSVNDKQNLTATLQKGMIQNGLLTIKEEIDQTQNQQDNGNSQDELISLMERKEQEMLNRRRNIYMNSKNANDILANYDKIMRTIEKVQKTTAQALETQRNEICEVLDNRLEEIKKQIKDEKAKKGESSADFKEREKELNDHLDTMTQIAQKIDFENRELMKKNVELNIQVKSQEQDRDILLQQLLYEKKEGKKLQHKLKDLKDKADILEKEQLQLNKETIVTQNSVSDESQAKQMNKAASQARLAETSPLVQNAVNNIHGIQTSTLPSIMTSMQMAAGSRQGSRAQLFVNQGASTLKQELNPKVQRYEQLIEQLRKMIQIEKRSTFQIKTLYSHEMEIRKELEKTLRQSIEDVRNEINKKKSETQNIYKQIKKAGSQDQLSLQEKERIIEVLLSQERVLTLLYDKTFPPRKELKPSQIAMIAQSQQHMKSQFTSIQTQGDEFSSTMPLNKNTSMPSLMEKHQSSGKLALTKTSTLSNMLNRNSSQRIMGNHSIQPRYKFL